MKHGGIRRASVLLFLAVALVGFSACRLVGQGTLVAIDDPSAPGVGDTSVLVFAPEPGDSWPPSGQAAALVTGTRFGEAPAYDMDGSLYLVNSTMATCPSAGADSRVFNFAGQAVNVVGTVTITHGAARQWLTIPFTDPQPMRHYLSWALVDVDPVPGSDGDHIIRRCGTMTWADE